MNRINILMLEQKHRFRIDIPFRERLANVVIRGVCLLVMNDCADNEQFPCGALQSDHASDRQQILIHNTYPPLYTPDGMPL